VDLNTTIEGPAIRRYDSRRNRVRFPISLLFAFGLMACAVPIEAGLDDAEANRVFVALDHANIEVSKEPDPGTEGKWRVTVAESDVARALTVMHNEGLPRQDTPGVLDSVGKGSLVPSEAAEHAQLIAAIASELERSLQGIDGVLVARVHLNVPAASPLRDLAPPRGTASVLLEHRGAMPPISVDSVQRLVAGGVTGLLSSDVVVVMVPHASTPTPGAGDLAHVGPIAVARASVQKLQAALVGLVALVALLAASTLVLYSRLSRARALSMQDPPPLPR
jgi:type III secretion protein J